MEQKEAGYIDYLLGGKELLNEAADDVHTATGKKKLMRDLCKNVLAEALEKVEKMPDTWDGFELRQYLADKFAEATGKMEAKRMKEYKNTIATVGGL